MYLGEKNRLPEPAEISRLPWKVRTVSITVWMGMSQWESALFKRVAFQESSKLIWVTDIDSKTESTRYSIPKKMYSRKRKDCNIVRANMVATTTPAADCVRLRSLPYILAQDAGGERGLLLYPGNRTWNSIHCVLANGHGSFSLTCYHLWAAWLRVNSLGTRLEIPTQPGPAWKASEPQQHELCPESISEGRRSEGPGSILHWGQSLAGTDCWASGQTEVTDSVGWLTYYQTFSNV